VKGNGGNERRAKGNTNSAKIKGSEKKPGAYQERAWPGCSESKKSQTDTIQKRGRWGGLATY